MKKLILSVFVSAFSTVALADQLVCGIGSPSTDPSNYNKTLFAGAVDNGDLFFVNPDGSVTKLSSSDIAKSSDTLKKYAGATVLVAASNDVVMSLGAGTWSSTKGFSSEVATAAPKNQTAVLFLVSKNIVISCNVAR